MANDELVKHLNGVLADSTVFYYKLHNYHWNVEGPSFFTLHEVFESLYTEWAGIMDTVAERVKGLGGRPVPGLKAVVELSALADEGETLSAEAMVERTVRDIHTQRERMKAASAQAVAANDKTTENILDEFLDSSAKHVWMLSAFLGKSVGAS